MLRKTLMIIAIAALTAPAFGQSYDEGVAQTGPASGPEIGQFEYSGAISNQQVSQLNAQAKGLVNELDQIDIQLAILDDLLGGHARGDILFDVSGFRTLMKRERLSEHVALMDTYARDVNPLEVLDTDHELRMSLYRQMSDANAARMSAERQSFFRRRAEILSRLDEIRRIVMADADRPGQAYDPNASHADEPDPDPGFAWDTRTRIHGIECFGGAEHEVYTDHYSLNGQYVGTDRRQYDAVRAPLVAGGAQFCGAWETRREETRKGSVSASSGPPPSAGDSKF